MPTPAERVNAAFTVWDNTFDSGDAAAVVALYVPDAWLLPSQAPSMHGAAQLLGFFQTAFKNGMTGHVLVPFDIIDLGDTLIANSTWKAQVITPGKPPLTVGGLATHVLQQQADGSLKLRVHTFNNGPLPT